LLKIKIIFWAARESSSKKTPLKSWHDSWWTRTMPDFFWFNRLKSAQNRAGYGRTGVFTQKINEAK
jgi:hypothetical protein